MPDRSNTLDLPRGIACLLLAMLILVYVDAVWASNHPVVPSSWDIAFYTFMLTGIAFSAAIITAYREYDWLVYVLLSLMLLSSVAALDGTVVYLFGGGDFVLWVVPFLVTSTTSAYGYWLVGLRIADSHSLGRYKQYFRSLALVTAVFPLSCILWLERISLQIMWVPVNVLFFGMVLAQILPPLSWPVTDSRLAGLIRIFPIVVGVPLVGMYGIHFVSSGFSQTHLIQLNQIAILLFAGFSLTIVIWQAFNSSRERDKAEKLAIETAKNEAELKLSLLQAERDYQRAQDAAASHRARLATVSHDLSQPISALRIAVDEIQRNRQGGEYLSQAVDYISSLARSFIDEGLADPANHSAASQQGDGVEVVDCGMFANSLAQMFSDDATQRGIELKAVCPVSQVSVEPLSTMRVMSNLISNAIKHSGATRILVGFRRYSKTVVFQVHDNGQGMDEVALSAALQPLNKGADSSGYGLGLGIVKELCAANNMGFTIRSIPGQGTSASVSMTRADSPESVLHGVQNVAN